MPWPASPYFCVAIFAICSLSASLRNFLLERKSIKNLSKARYQPDCSSMGRSSTRKMFQRTLVPLLLTFDTLGPFHTMSDRYLGSSSDPSSSRCCLFYSKGSGHKTDCMSYPGSMSQTWSEMHINHRFLRPIDLDCQHVLIDLN